MSMPVAATNAENILNTALAGEMLMERPSRSLGVLMPEPCSEMIESGSRCRRPPTPITGMPRVVPSIMLV